VIVVKVFLKNMPLVPPILAVLALTNRLLPLISKLTSGTVVPIPIFPLSKVVIG
jgi:hypothetical protein